MPEGPAARLNLARQNRPAALDSVCRWRIIGLHYSERSLYKGHNGDYRGVTKLPKLKPEELEISTARDYRRRALVLSP